mgnify:CR=1 FL=1
MNLGGFQGGDPRKFFPDPEMSTEAEMKAHAEACKAWDHDERPEFTLMVNTFDPKTGRGMHASIRPFGIGFTQEEAETEDPEQEPDLPLEEQSDEELYSLYLSHAGHDSEQAMEILADRHSAETQYEDDPAERMDEPAAPEPIETEE